MKTVSADRSYIDYTTLTFGVRVRETSCRSLTLTNAGWEEYGDQLGLPVAAPVIDPLQNETTDDLPVSFDDLKINVLDYETSCSGDSGEDKRELRQILLGMIDMNTALSRNSGIL